MKEERGSTVNLVVFQDSDLREMALHEWLDLRQDRVFVISDREAQGDLDERALLGRGYASVSVYSNYIGNGAIDADVLGLHARFGIDRIVAMGEDDVIRAARLRTVLNLPGQSLESAVAYRDKVVMKTLLREAGVPVTPFRALGSPMDLIEFEREYPLPLFIKPISSSGGTGVRPLLTRAELRAFLETGFIARFPGSEYLADLMVEKLVEGRLYHVDGLVVEGRIEIAVPSTYLFSQRKAVRGSRTMEKEESLYRRLRAVVESALGALPSPGSFSFHAEVFHTAEDEILVNEIASRTGGGKIGATVGVVAGMNLNHLSILAQRDAQMARHALKEARPASPCAGFSLISSLERERMSVPRACPFSWVSDYSVYLPPASDQLVAAVVSGESARVVEERLERFNDWILGAV